MLALCAVVTSLYLHGKWKENRAADTEAYERQVREAVDNLQLGLLGRVAPGKYRILARNRTISQESLKVGVDGETSDRPALIAYLDDTLAQLGRNNGLAKDAIDSYRKRILGAV